MFSDPTGLSLTLSRWMTTLGCSDWRSWRCEQSQVSRFLHNLNALYHYFPSFFLECKSLSYVKQSILFPTSIYCPSAVSDILFAVNVNKVMPGTEEFHLLISHQQDLCWSHCLHESAEIRKVLSKYVGAKLPDPPPLPQRTAYGSIPMTAIGSLFDLLHLVSNASTKSKWPVPMEHLRQVHNFPFQTFF